MVKRLLICRLKSLLRSWYSTPQAFKPRLPSTPDAYRQRLGNCWLSWSAKQ